MDTVQLAPSHIAAESSAGRTRPRTLAGRTVGRPVRRHAARLWHAAVLQAVCGRNMPAHACNAYFVAARSAAPMLSAAGWAGAPQAASWVSVGSSALTARRRGPRSPSPAGPETAPAGCHRLRCKISRRSEKGKTGRPGPRLAARAQHGAVCQQLGEHDAEREDVGRAPGLARRDHHLGRHVARRAPARARAACDHDAACHGAPLAGRRAALCVRCMRRGARRALASAAARASGAFGHKEPI